MDKLEAKRRIVDHMIVHHMEEEPHCHYITEALHMAINALEQYEDLREAFVDFVCSGIHNPAPYCKNSCNECVDSRGYCTYKKCRGFNPDGRVYEEV